jgi:hypothetical protein
MNDPLQKERHLSRLELEIWLSAESGSEDRILGTHPNTGVTAHLADCAECNARLTQMRAQGKRFRFRNPSFAALSARRRKPAWWRNLRPIWTRSKPLVTFFASLVMIFSGTLLWSKYANDGLGDHPIDGHGYAMKGKPSFVIFDSRRKIFNPGDTVGVHAGDTLQLAIASPSVLFYRVFTRAENGSISELMPLTDEADSLKPATKGAVLPHSLVFAEPVHPERIVCVWSHQPVDWKTARSLISNPADTPNAGVDSFQIVRTP